MSASTKLSTAVKALSYLSESFPAPKSSIEISEKIGINASKIRKILSMLVKEKMVVSIKGVTGGFLLNKSPMQIHLQEIYCAVETRKAFHLDVTQLLPDPKDENSKFNNYFLDLFAEVQVEIEEKMRNITLKSIMDKIGIHSSYNHIKK